MSSELTVFGVETSCDETAAAVVRRHADGRVEVLSNVVASQMEHALYGGVVPEIAARAHMDVVEKISAEALKQAGVTALDLDAVAATAGPGLIGGVMVGLSFAKGLALAANKPLIAVNHLEGHALSVRLTEACDYPFLLLLTSGGHCQLLDVAGPGACTRLGSTIDDAAGEAFDKIAKVLGLGYPGGPALEKEALGGDAKRFELPRALLGRAGFDFSFSGLKTAAARLAASEVKLDQDRKDVAASVQAAIARQLAERSERAMIDYASRHARKTFVVAGGVAANQTVRGALLAACTRQGFDFLAPPLAYCTDNAAMIALAGLERFAKGDVAELSVSARPRWPLDETSAALDPVHKKAGRKGSKA